MCIGASTGGLRGTPGAPYGPKFSQFHAGCFFFYLAKLYVGAPLQVGAPLPTGNPEFAPDMYLGSVPDLHKEENILGQKGAFKLIYILLVHFKLFTI